jgi:plastocyanin
LFAVPVFVAGALVALAACGGGTGTPTGPGNTGGGSPGPSGATITIANGRMTPSDVTISVGQSVTFVNNDGRVHNVSSDPHPVHTDCPQINAVGNLGNGQTRLTNALPTARSCGFHDHDDPDNGALKGRINIQ